jgi:hypothetical protein
MRTETGEGLQVKFLLLLFNFNQNWDMRKFLEQLPNFRGNPFSGSLTER